MGALASAFRVVLACTLALMLLSPVSFAGGEDAWAAEPASSTAAAKHAASGQSKDGSGSKAKQPAQGDSASSGDSAEKSQASQPSGGDSASGGSSSASSDGKAEGTQQGKEDQGGSQSKDPAASDGAESAADSGDSAQTAEGDSGEQKEGAQQAEGADSQNASGTAASPASADPVASAESLAGQAQEAPTLTAQAQTAGDQALLANSSAAAAVAAQADDDKKDGEPTLKSARLLIYNSKTKKYEPFKKTTSEGKPQTVAAVRDAANFDVQLTYSDGSTKRASQAGVTVSWKLDNNVQAGKQVASIDKSGKLTISGVSSKLVQLKATLSGGDVKVQGSPAYINLVSDTVKPSTDKTVDSIAVSYSGSGEGAGSGTAKPAADAGNDRESTADDDGVAEEPVPSITVAGGSLLFSASVTFVDAAGNRTTSSGSLADAQLAWQIVALYNQMHERTNTIIATVSQQDQTARLTATQAGDGWVVLRCASNAFPDFAGQEILVRIAGNIASSDAAVAANTFTGAALAYEDPATKTYKPYSGNIANTPTVINTPGGSVGFDALLTFADGSTALASQRGLAVDYLLAGNVSAGQIIAKMAPDGTLSATHTKDGTVRIASATVNGQGVAGTSAYVRIKNNDASVKPLSDGLVVQAMSNYWIGASQRPDDATRDWYWRAVPTAGTGGYSVPLAVATLEAYSTCKLSAQVRWNNSTVTSSQDEDGGVRHWSIVKSTSSDGKANGALASVGSDGTVRPTGGGSGYVTVRCTVDLPTFDAAGNKTTMQLATDYKVGVYASQGYVKKIVLLDEKGSPIKTSSIKLASGKNTYNFGALVTYVGYDAQTHAVNEFEVNTRKEPDKIEGLEWKVYRTEERSQEELYSQIREDGSFRAQSGFARAYVYANVPRGSFTGKDIGVGVTVIAEDSIERLGHTDSVDVKMYHYSDYMNHGAEAKPAKEVTFTRGQLSGAADYTTWYTFQRRGDAFSTVYARGLTMRTLLALCGVDPERLISMAFMGSDGYFAQRHSASFILGTQYRYTNYYYHKDLPGLMGAQSVSPMFALSYYMKNNAGYEDATDKANAGSAGFGYMTSDSTFRIIFGMTGAGVRNANLSVSNVGQIEIIVEDNTFPPEKEEEPEPEPKSEEAPPAEEQKGTPGVQGDPNAESGDSSNPFVGGSDAGVGTDAKKGGNVAVTDKKADGEAAEAGEKDASNDHADDKGSQHGESSQDAEVVKGETDQSGNPLIRELQKNPRPVLPPAEISAVWWTIVAMGALFALFFGGMFSGRRYALDRADGLRIGAKQKTS